MQTTFVMIFSVSCCSSADSCIRDMWAWRSKFVFACGSLNLLELGSFKGTRDESCNIENDSLRFSNQQTPQKAIKKETCTSSYSKGQKFSQYLHTIFRNSQLKGRNQYAQDGGCLVCGCCQNASRYSTRLHKRRYVSTQAKRVRTSEIAL